MTDEKGLLLPEYANPFYKKEYTSFQKIYHALESDRNIFLAQAYRYSHDYGPNHMNIEQKILEITTGILLIRELPDTVKLKETEAEAYAAVWDIMIALEKELPMPTPGACLPGACFCCSGSSERTDILVPAEGAGRIFDGDRKGRG